MEEENDLWYRARTSLSTTSEYPRMHLPNPSYHQHDFAARRSEIRNTPLLHKAADNNDYGREIRDRMIRFHLLFREEEQKNRDETGKDLREDEERTGQKKERRGEFTGKRSGP